MAVNLTQKEKMLLNDQKTHEQVCIAKYQDYANRSQDAQLNQLFNSLGQQEKEHLNSINQILSGQIPNTNQGQSQQSAMQGQAQSSSGSQNMAGSASGSTSASSNTSGSSSASSAGSSSQHDASLCNDMLMTEKYVSGAYDTAIFEFTDSNIRQVLNHIQKEEQQHGEKIFNYMQQNNMYNVNS